MINKLSIIGIGLIGGSLARALRRQGYAREIIGHGRHLTNLQWAVERGVIDRVEVNPTDAVREADMVVLAVPVGSMSKMLAEIASSLIDGAVVTDVGSVKQSVIEAARAALKEKFPSFVPGHPLAGVERSGVMASDEHLFRNRRVILTPEADTDAAAVARVRAMWQVSGAQVVTMDSGRHDRVLAASSHLPHMLAYALMDMLVRQDDHRDIFECAATGFRDFTRIASSDPTMWRDICLANRDAVMAMLRQYQEDLGELIAAIAQRDGQSLLETFTRAKQARAQFLKQDE